MRGAKKRTAARNIASNDSNTIAQSLSLPDGGGMSSSMHNNRSKMATHRRRHNHRWWWRKSKSSAPQVTGDQWRLLVAFFAMITIMSFGVHKVVHHHHMHTHHNHHHSHHSLENVVSAKNMGASLLRRQQPVQSVVDESNVTTTVVAAPRPPQEIISEPMVLPEERPNNDDEQKDIEALPEEEEQEDKRYSEPQEEAQNEGNAETVPTSSPTRDPNEHPLFDTDVDDEDVAAPRKSQDLLEQDPLPKGVIDDSPATVTVATNLTKPAGTLYVCGPPMARFIHSVFPEYCDNEHQSEWPAYTKAKVKEDSSVFGKDDILLMFGYGWSCNDKVNSLFVSDHFPGKALYVNGGQGGHLLQKFGHHTHPDHFYQVGSVLDNPFEQHSIRVYYLALVLLEYYTEREENWIFQQPTELLLSGESSSSSQRPQWNGDRHAILYMQTDCTPLRDSMMDHLVNLTISWDQQAKGEEDGENGEASSASLSSLQVEYGSRCHGTLSEEAQQGKVQQVPASIMNKYPDATREHWQNNYKIYHHYKYCLVAENSYTPGYISEKLLLAFLGGCLPIYWGNPEVLDVFDKRSFLYWKMSDTTMEANNDLDEILWYLEQNETAYRERLEAPILKHGADTIRDFFSLRDNLADGHLKGKIRDMLSLN